MLVSYIYGDSAHFGLANAWTSMCMLYIISAFVFKRVVSCG